MDCVDDAVASHTIHRYHYKYVCAIITKGKRGPRVAVNCVAPLRGGSVVVNVVGIRACCDALHWAAVVYASDTQSAAMKISFACTGFTCGRR